MDQLNASTLVRLPDDQRPRYDRTKVRSGIVHFGVGGFHRSHQAMYMDAILAMGDSSWGVTGVGTQPADRRMQRVLAAQDRLYSLMLKHSDGRVETRVLGSLADYLHALDDPAAVIERVADPATRIVSLTVTEGGYPVDLSTRTFQPVEPTVSIDLEASTAPTTTFGLIAAGLATRRSRGHGGLAVVSCDNVPGNGEVAKAAVLGFALHRDAELAEWVHANVDFPNSMVDRITPVTTDADVALAQGVLGVYDEWPVVAEPFHQWVLEETGAIHQPTWEAAGVQVVDDVTPYELMKLRLLNAGHQAIGYLGYLAGYRHTDEACSDPVLRQFLLDYLEREATPTLPSLPGIDIAAYRQTLVERFANPYIRDTLARLCAESSDRIATFVLPVICDQLAAGRDVSRCALIVAAWARYAEGIDEAGDPILVVDRLLETVRAAADAHRADPVAFLNRIPLLRTLAQRPAFVSSFATHVANLHTRGARATVAALTDPH